MPLYVVGPTAPPVIDDAGAQGSGQVCTGSLLCMLVT